MLGTVRPVPSAFNGPFHLGKVGCGADSAIPDAEAQRPVSDSKAARCGRPLRHLSQVGSLGPRPDQNDQLANSATSIGKKKNGSRY